MTKDEFSANWLALREPADHRARNASVRDAAMQLFAGKNVARLVDLGCGSGSNLRALASYLPPVQYWRLVDHDPALLNAAREALIAWADHAEPTADGGLSLRKRQLSIDVAFVGADLSGDLNKVLDPAVDLVTAAAFFDLVAVPWIAHFCAALTARRLPLYAVLTYDGVETWVPSHPEDAAMRAAFHAHQAGDKGFGTAAGPTAITALTQAFGLGGWKITHGSSPWQLGAADSELIAMLAEGSAKAVADTGLVAPSRIEDWLASRRAANTCEIGHADFLAVPILAGT